MPTVAQSTGWRVDGVSAIHESCNAGYILVNGIVLTAGHTYQLSYQLSIDNGYTRAQVGNVQGIQRTAGGSFIETLTADGDGIIKFYSTGDCTVSLLTYKEVIDTNGIKSRNTIAFSEPINKWVSFRTYSPDMGFSLFRNLYTLKDGQLYIHQQNSPNRNNFYGIQYKSIINFVSNQQPTIVKAFNSISYQANELLVTGDDGITTSLGQISELIEEDFLRTILADATTSINVYDQEGIFQAAFLRDKNIDLINGDALKGNYITIQLMTTNNNVLKIFSIDTNYSVSHNGVR